MLEFLQLPWVQSLVLSPVIGVVLGLFADKYRKENITMARPQRAGRQQGTGGWNVHGHNNNIRNQSDDNYRNENFPLARSQREDRHQTTGDWHIHGNNNNIRNQSDDYTINITNKTAPSPASSGSDDIWPIILAFLGGLTTLILGYSFYQVEILHVSSMLLTVTSVALTYVILMSWSRSEISLMHALLVASAIALVMVLGYISLDWAKEALYPDVRDHIARAYYKYKILALLHIQRPVQIWVLLQILGLTLTLLSPFLILTNVFKNREGLVSTSVAVGAIILAGVGVFATMGEAFDLIRGYVAM